MTTVGAFEAKTHFAQLLPRVERGEEITITRHGKAVARLVPAAAKPDTEAVLATFRRLRERAKRSGPGQVRLVGVARLSRSGSALSFDGRPHPRQLDRLVLVPA